MLSSATNRTKISPLAESHFATLYEWILDNENIMLWSNIREIPSKEDYFRYLKLKIEFNFVAQFIISKANSDNPIGTIFIHDQNFDDEYASISAYIVPEERIKTHGMEAYFLAFNYVFTTLPVRKLYMDVFSYNHDSIKLIEKAGFNLEGTFKEHRKTKDGFCDLFRYSFFKKDWQLMKAKNPNLIK